MRKYVYIRKLGIYSDEYQIDDEGNLYSLKNGKEILRKWVLDRYGYNQAKIIHNKLPYKIIAHTAVADAFIYNADNKPEINHINCIKTDNRVCNLEWVTSAENKKHAWKNGLYKSKRL